jgi:hypothetical protein
MKNKLKYYSRFTLVAITLLGFFWCYISREDKDVAEYTETSGFVTFYDADFGEIRRIKLDPVSTRVFRNPDGTKYLLQSKNPDQSTSIYDVNGSKLNEVFLAGEHIVTPNSDYVLIQKTFEKNKKPWELTYDYGLVLLKTKDEVQESSTELTPTAKIIMWGKSILAVYDKDENKIYEELFFGRNPNMEKLLPCAGSKIVVLTSEYEYPEKFGPDWEYYKTNQRISFSVIDYHQNRNDFQLDIDDVNLQDVNDFKFNFEDIQWPIYCGTKLASVEEFFKIDAEYSQNGMHVAGIINNLTVFLIDVGSEKVVFTEPLNSVISGNIHNKILQVGASNRGIVHILRYYTGNENFLVYENYDKIGDVKRMYIVEDMEDTAKMFIDEDKVVITDNGREKTIRLF